MQISPHMAIDKNLIIIIAKHLNLKYKKGIDLNIISIAKCLDYIHLPGISICVCVDNVVCNSILQ